MKTELAKYSRNTTWIHWVSALLIFGLLFTGINMEHSPNTMTKFNLYKIHFALGFTVFLLTIWRTIVLFKDKRPKPLYDKNSARQRFISFVHYGFYIVIIYMCVSGILSLFAEGITPALVSGNVADLPEMAKGGFSVVLISHHIVAKFVFLLLIFHLVGFLSHLISKKENTLKRIWNFRQAENNE